jgi:hypothetical protein
MPEILRIDKRIETSILADTHFVLRSYNNSQRNREISRQLSYRNYGADYDKEFEMDYYYYFNISTYNLPVEIWWDQLIKF